MQTSGLAERCCASFSHGSCCFSKPSTQKQQTWQDLVFIFANRLSSANSCAHVRAVGAKAVCHSDMFSHSGAARQALSSRKCVDMKPFVLAKASLFRLPTFKLTSNPSRPNGRPSRNLRVFNGLQSLADARPKPGPAQKTLFPLEIIEISIFSNFYRFFMFFLVFHPFH